MTRFILQRTAHALRDGEVIAYPTEAVFGLGCDPGNGDAVARLLQIKRRPVDKGLILLASRFEQLVPFVLPVDADLQQQLDASWPGPTTWLLPARPQTPTWLRGRHTTLAVRVTAHPLAAALCDAFGGAIVSTSANVSGRPPARNALQARLRCPGMDRILAGPTGGQNAPAPFATHAAAPLCAPADPRHPDFAGETRLS